MATEVVKIVDPDNGTGTDYTSLAAWESGEQRDLVSADEIAVAKCRCTGGTADSTAVDINGWTADSTRYCKIYCDLSDTGGDGRNGSYAHKGVWPASGSKIYRLTNKLTSYVETKIYDLAIKANVGIFDGVVKTAGSTTHVHSVYRCYIETTASGSVILNTDNTYGSFKIYNTICVGAGGYNHGACTMVYMRGNYGGHSYAYNVTAICTGTCYSVFSGSYNSKILWCYNTIAKSNAFYSGGGCYVQGAQVAVKGDYTVASDSTYPIDATNYWTNVTPSFVDETNKDFHLAANDTVAKDKGYDYSSEGYNDDIDDETRSGTWDIGADEYVSAGGSALPVFMRTYRARRL